MLLPDVNILVYAHRQDAPHHEACRRWLEGVINSDEAAVKGNLVPDASLAALAIESGCEWVTHRPRLQPVSGAVPESPAALNTRVDL